MSINKKITELDKKIIDPDDIFIIADANNNYQITMGEISGALKGSGPAPGESTYAYFSDFQNNAGTVTIKEYDSGGNILQKVISDDFSNFKAFLNWDGPGAIDYRGTGFIEDIEIPAANTTETLVGSRNFVGFIDNLDVSSKIPLQLSGRANGQISILDLEIAGPAPTPHTILIEAIDQTSSADGISLFPGDTVDVFAWFDFSNHSKSEEPFEFRIANPSTSSATQGSLGADDLLAGTSFSEWNQPWLSNNPLDSTLSGISLQSTVNNVSDGTIEHGVRVECRNRFGKVSIASSYGDDGLGGLVGGISAAHSAGVTKYYHSHLVGTPPSVNILGIEYPSTSPTRAPVSTYDQQAIKAGDVVYVENECADYDSVEYTSPNGELTIENPNTFEQFKKVIFAAGTYNINVNNFKITARKQTLSTTKQTCIKIADEPLELDIKNLSSKIKSSPSGNSDTFALQSSQLQLVAPTLELDPTQNPQSTLTRVSSGTGTTGNNFRIIVRDPDQKGTFTWSNILGVNLAGKETTTLKAGDENYTIEGFTSRQLTALGTNGWKGLYPIGTTVTDPNNVSFVSDATTYNGGVFTYHAFSAGHEIHLAGGGAFNIMYTDNVGNPGNLGNNKFTIVTLKDGTDPSNTTKLSFDPNGDHIFILDFGVRSVNFSSHTATAQE